ncbi:MAG: TonB-dependent receptor [Phenylobacterium sp.]|uniref:TonB-dependent receptor n=1 Tax=Phenylobacterium sp. TaxID=1871053 RepID=UPI00391938EE
MPFPPPPPPAEVEAVIVHPPRLPPAPGEAAFAVQRLQVEDLSASPRLDEALKRSPGVSLFRRTGSDAANPTIQGLSLRDIAPSGAGRALVTLDGAPQNDPFGGWVIWSSLPPEGLAGASIVRGAGAGPFGAGALTGVVALEERDARSGLAALEVSAGSRDSYRAAVAGGGPGLLLTAAGSTTDGYVPVRGAAQGAADVPTTLSDYAASARLQRMIGGASAALRLGVYEERRGAGLVGAGSVASGGSAALTMARAPGAQAGGWRLQAWVRSSDLENRSAAVAGDRSGTTPANDQYSTPALGWGLNAAWRSKTAGLTWELGADARFAEGRTNERYRNLGAGFTRGREAGGRTAVGGLYGEASLVRERVILTGGARVDAWSNSEAVRRERDLGAGALLLDQSAPDNSGTTPTARIGLRYALGRATWLRAAAYSGFRPPTLNELHRPFRVGNDVTEANADLKPETLYGIEAGLQREGAADWSLTVFYNELQDPITNVTVGAGPATFPTAGFIPAGGVLRQRRNAGAIEAWGVEANLAWTASPTLGLRAAASATRAEVDGGEAAPQLTGKRPAQTPELTVTAGLDWTPAPRLRLSADARYESARFEDDLNSRKLSPAVTLDARAAWRLRPDAEVYLAVENLGDAEVEIGETAGGVESYAAPRTVRVGVSIRR